MIRKLTVLVAGPVLAVALFATAQAMSDGGSDSGTGSSGASSSGDNSAATPTTRRCFFGRVWDAEKRRCVQPDQESSIGQDEIYAYGRDMADQGYYEDAIAVLVQAPDQTDPRVLNFLGFSNRKLGRIDDALGYYRTAVAYDPDYPLVREYLGEAYVQLGDYERAREQLTQIERICGSRTCAEYSVLAQLIVDSQTQ